MENRTFVAWALWEQMTFVLAMGIVAVFCIGLGKLWWANRLLRKLEVIAQEKRARIQEMRSVGLPVKRPTDIPFGIRAIQSGIQVEGIWISRFATPYTPNQGSLDEPASSASRVASDSPAPGKKWQRHPLHHMETGSPYTPQSQQLWLNDTLQSPSLQGFADRVSLDSSRPTSPHYSALAAQHQSNGGRHMGTTSAAVFAASHTRPATGGTNYGAALEQRLDPSTDVQGVSQLEHREAQPMFKERRARNVPSMAGYRVPTSQEPVHQRKYLPGWNPRLEEPDRVQESPGTDATQKQAGISGGLPKHGQTGRGERLQERQSRSRAAKSARDTLQRETG